MDLLKRKIAEARKIYEIFWESYQNGNLESFASTLDDTFEMIGTSETEVCHSKADGIAFFKAQMEEVVGKVEMRNRQVDVLPVDNLMLVNEQCDIYVLTETDLPAHRQVLSNEKPVWTFYSKIRISTFLRETGLGWKVIQQHGSLPDMRVEEGETMALEKISKENLELRDAVKRRTAELENKNRELAIEAALEKVRAVAMGMKKPEDMLDVCRIISDQLQQFGVDKIRNVQIAIIDENIGQYLCYQYFTPYDKTTIEKTEYLKSPVEYGMVRQMLASRDGYFIGRLSGKELEDFRIHRKEENHFTDPFLDKATELDYCFLSIGEGGLGLTLYQPMAEDILTLFKRFHQVFSLAYQRFRDIQKAEAQARESQIEAALERVRAQTMAMHNSEDVGKSVVKMFSELTALGVDEGTRFGIGILNHDNENNQLWTARKTGEEVNMHIGNIDMAWHPMLKRARQAWLEQVPFHKYVLEGEDLLNYYQMLNNAPDYKIQIPIEKLPKKEIQHCFIFEHGFFYAFSPREFQPELIHITKRFSALFEQTYRRYLDLVRAETQAREAEIELALERVRARTMAMQHTEELKEVIQVVFEQMVGLNVHVDHAGFILDYKEREDMHIWLADQNGVPSEIRIPYFDAPHWNSFLEAKKNGDDFFANYHDFEEKNKFYNTLFELIPGLSDEIKAYYLECPSLDISTVLMDNVGLYIERFSGTPYIDADNQTLKRFGKVFQQAYTRFLDLQRAEKQALEAQIETALEKVRSRSLAMHSSDELNEVVKVLFEKMTELQVPSTAIGIQTFPEGSKDMQCFVCGDVGNGMVINQYLLPYFDHPILNDYIESHRKGLDHFVGTYSKELKDSLYEVVLELPELKDIPVEVKAMILESKFYEITMVSAKKSTLAVNDFIGNPLSESQIAILKRFTKVFDQSYLRFLDLQKAEAQAREAQIEAALEKVRSRSLAMHKSGELNEVVSVLFERLKELQIPFTAIGIATRIEDSKDLNAFVCGDNADGLVITNYRLPYFENQIPKDFYNALEKQLDFFVGHYSKEEKDAFYNYVIENTAEFRHLPEDIKQLIFDSTNYTISTVAVKNAVFNVNDFEGKVLAEHEVDIIKRFARVFDQAYTRFLDLQKVEAQAREAQIEASLERIRAKAMSMHHSDELDEVLAVLCEQFDTLGIFPMSTHMTVLDIEHNKFTFRETGKFGNRSFGEQTVALDAMDTWNDMVDSWKSAEPYSINRLHFPKDTLAQVWEVFHESFASMPEGSKITPDDYPDGIYHTAGKHPFGYIGMNQVRPATEKEEQIVIKFANEFGRAYQRFLDLQKAEAQAREAKIETALERVRAQAMAMHHSEDLGSTIQVYFEQLDELMDSTIVRCGAGLLNKENTIADMSTASKSPEGVTYNVEGKIDMRGHALLENTYEHWLKQKEYSHVLRGNEIKEYYQYITNQVAIPENKGGDELHFYFPMFNEGSFYVVTNNEVPEDELQIFRRFSSVLSLTYRRFNDLQKAEAQAHEAKIEAALERVRSRTMGMQSSEELPEVANLLFTEVRSLGIPAWSCGYNILTEDKKTATAWMSSEGIMQTPFQLRLFGEASFDEMGKFILSDHTMFVQELGGKALEDHYAYMKTFPDLKSTFENIEAKGISLPTYQINHLCKFTSGFLLFITYEPVPDAHGIFKRFTSVFDQTYTRFLDLKKAEAQTREAQIENALEKVRSRSLAMQSPDELIEVAQLLREEMGALGVEELETSSIYIQDESSGNTQCWFTIKDSDSGKAVTDQMTMDLQDTWVGQEMLTFYRSEARQTSIRMQGEQRMEWMRYCGEKSNAFTPEGFYGESIPERTYHLYKFSNGYIGAASSGDISNESWDLLKRATAVFSFAYTRFRDLQKAENRAREARIELALERIRAQVASMQESSDLFDIVVGMRTEFLALGHEADYFWHMRWLPESYEMSMTSEDGSRIGMVISLPKVVHDEIPELAEWEKGNDPIYVLALDPEGAWSYIENMNTHGSYELADPNAPGKEDIEHIGGLTFIMARTTHGEIGYGLPGMVPEPPKDALDTLVRFAGVFDLAYKRFEDLKSAERQALMIREERDRLEIALKELHATQDQLVQQEKLASLGQLTAGIAHEIKNPLNFVNNFSEVSIEMIEEILEARSERRDLRQSSGTEKSGGKHDESEEMEDEILEDIKGNLKKIHEHGSRANGIVTSMLQHSRGGSGKMEPTDLNALIKEYVNLSFHGMRAGKNPINVDIQVDLDPDLGMVSMIKEDFTRVVINLCNNAFDAMREKTNMYNVPSTMYQEGVHSEVKYLPKLKVTTMLEKGRVRLLFEDNGPGIPDEIKDKILQPFFTTKKGTEGTGLGLSITHDIVKAHGGELRVETLEGEGTTFIIQLPKK